MQLYLRKYNYQIILKLILAIYSIIIVSTGMLVLPKILYWVIVLCYLLVEFVFSRYAFYREKAHIADLVLVLLILSGTELNNFLIFTYLLYPFASRGVYIDRFTYDKYYYLEFFVVLLVLNLTVEKHNYSYYLCQLLPLFFFMLLNGMSVLRMRYDEKKIKILDIADDYFIQQTNSYEVYRQIINYLKDQGIFVSNITCVECDKNMRKFHIVNSSYLISSCQLRLKHRDVLTLNNGMTVNNTEFRLNGQIQKKNDVYPINQTNNSPHDYFLFVVSYQQDNIKSINLEPLFLRMARLISFERIMRKRRDASIQDILQKSRFVNSATNTMHFLKNRLTPLQTLIDLVKNEGGVKQLEEYDQLLLDTAHSAQKEVNVILSKAEYLLNKQNNPFIFSTESYDAHSIFTTLASVWTNAFPTLSITTETNDGGDDVMYDTNIEGLEILFSDIVGNMKKYSKNLQQCSFSQKDAVLTITFENDFGVKNDVKSLISDINNPNKDAVIYRTSYGVSNIRAITENLSIGLRASLITDRPMEIYKLELNFISNRNEDTDN